MSPRATLGGPVLAAGLLAALHAAPALTSVPALRTRLLPRLAGRSGDPATVALTFDDGPDPASTPAFLDALAGLDVRATFFVLGTAASAAPDLLRRVAAEGHEVGVHGWTHRNHLRLAPGTVVDEVRRTADLVQRLTGERPRWFRPPYGVLTGGGLLGARRAGLTPALWTAWGHDWEATATPASVLARLEQGGVRGGATLLLHDTDVTSAPLSWHAALGVLPDVARLVRERGARLAPLGEHLPV